MSLPTVALLVLTPSVVLAQNGGFITRLGTDTVQVEQFSRNGSELTGVVVTRTPVVRVTRWSMTLDDAGVPRRYQADATDGAGVAVLNGLTGSFVYESDSLTRVGYGRGSSQTARIATQALPFPAPGLPYIGISNLMYEMALADARRRAAGGDSAAYFITLNVGQARPQRLRTWIPASDSMELDYFGVARSGYRFDRSGRLLRADWRNTTYRYRIERTGPIDVLTVAAAWSAAEQSGRSFGALSPRDSVIRVVDGNRFTIDYSRPARRGRAIWGEIVPYDKVWRLGADMATHFTTPVDIDLGGTTVPAGRYTLWMIPSATTPQLVVSRAVNVFGTNYDPTKDLARVPLKRSAITAPVERLTLDIRDGQFSISWDDIQWTVPIGR